MKIYTKGGDDGETGLFGGQRVPKNDRRVEAYGSVDEANAAVGMALSQGVEPACASVLEAVQNELFVLGAELSTPPERRERLGLPLIGPPQVSALERAIDLREESLPPLKAFILPGGTPSASALHFARTVCRRAERMLIEARAVVAPSEHALRYLNRLSDLLFVLARQENHRVGRPDVPWSKPSGP